MRKFGIVAVLLALSMGFSGCGPVAPDQNTSVFEGARAHALVEDQVSFGPRYPGSEGHRAVQNWIAETLDEHGWEVERQEFTYRETELTNLIGRNSYQAAPFFIIGAHYDTRPIADEVPEANPDPVIGANDGGSGVAVLLELARVLPREDLECQLWLTFFDAEDSGGIEGWEWIVGSTYLAESLPEKPTGVVIVDMVGDRQLSLPKEINSSDELQDEIWQAGQALGYQAFEDRQGYSILDDHTPFLRKGIPAVDIIDFDYPFWHTEQDTLDKISAQSLETVGRTLQHWLQGKCVPGGAN